MKNIIEIKSFFEKNEEYLHSTFHLSKLGIFGSYVYGTPTETSDIDVLIEFNGKIDNIYDNKCKLIDFISEN